VPPGASALVGCELGMGMVAEEHPAGNWPRGVGNLPPAGVNSRRRGASRSFAVEELRRRSERVHPQNADGA